MLQEMSQHIIYQFNYGQLYLLVFAYFLFLYFVLAPLFLSVCIWLEKRGYLYTISQPEADKKQINFEIWHSLKSIFIFGFSGIPLIYLIREGHIQILEDTAFNIIWGVVVLNIWNELHFFVVHRIMHLPWFMKRVHYIHHRSRTPSVYSVYSFHWFEAFLLSTVPLSIAIWLPLAPLSFAIYPLTSILLNYCGHCNYRFGKGTGADWQLFATHHHEHHSRAKKNYGFASNILDKIYTNILNSKKS